MYTAATHVACKSRMYTERATGRLCQKSSERVDSNRRGSCESLLCADGRRGAGHCTSMACASKALEEHGGVSVDVRDGREARLYDIVERPEMEPTNDERERERCMGLSATKSKVEPPRDAGQWPNREPPMEPARDAGRELGVQLGGRRHTSGPPGRPWEKGASGAEPKASGASEP